MNQKSKRFISMFSLKVIDLALSFRYLMLFYEIWACGSTSLFCTWLSVSLAFFDLSFPFRWLQYPYLKSNDHGYTLWTYFWRLNSISLIYTYVNFSDSTPVFWLLCFVVCFQIRKNELHLPFFLFFYPEPFSILQEF